MPTIIELDLNNMIALTTAGEMLVIEDFWDESGQPCLPDEAVIANIQIKNGKYLEYYLEDTDRCLHTE